MRQPVRSAPVRPASTRDDAFEAILKPWAKTVGPCGVALGEETKPSAEEPVSSHNVVCPVSQSL